MLVEGRFPSKSFAALGTAKWLLPGVDPDVLLQGPDMNGSISTIFTMDVYRAYATNNPSNARLVNIGRSTSVVALVIAVFSATPLLGSLESAFQYIQNFTGFFTPGILVIFLVALFWPKATTLSVLNAALTSLALSIFIFYFFP